VVVYLLFSFVVFLPYIKEGRVHKITLTIYCYDYYVKDLERDMAWSDFAQKRGQTYSLKTEKCNKRESKRVNDYLKGG